MMSPMLCQVFLAKTGEYGARGGYGTIHQPSLQKCSWMGGRKTWSKSMLGRLEAIASLCGSLCTRANII